MQRRKLLWFAVVGVAVVLVQSWASARPGNPGNPGKTGSGEGEAPMTVPQGATQIVLARTDGPFSLEGGPLHVPMKAMQTRSNARARSLAALLERVQPDEHVLLVLRDLQAAQPPNIVVQIYLGLGEGENPTPDDPHYAGTLNFFNVVRPPGAEVAHAPAQFDSFDVTDVIQNLRTSKKLTDPVLLTLQPVGRAAEGSKPSIGRIDLVLQ
jgi:hypothetical protein